jgi:hypothetical protein
MPHFRNQPGRHSRLLEESPSNKLHTSIHHLKRTIRFRAIVIRQIRDLLLEVGTQLEKLNVCKLSQISTRIKQILREEILAKKITTRYKHKVLPERYKRTYRIQRELGSLNLGYYDFLTCTSSRKKFSFDGNFLQCQISLPLRWFKRRIKECELVFPSKSVWFRMDIDFSLRRLIYFGLGDGARSPPLYCIPLHRDND